MQLADFQAPLDLRLYHLLNRDGGPVLDGVMRLLSTHAFGIAFGLLLCGLLVCALRWGAQQALTALPAALLLSDLVGARLLRPAFPRMRPCYALPPGTFRWLAPAANGPSLPSLHASNMFALALVVTLARPRLGPLAYAAAVAVSLSRVYVGVHWPSDVLAGAIWGTLAGAAGWVIARIIVERGSSGPKQKPEA